jgi:periplasmic divalent cation tolerance protein
MEQAALVYTTWPSVVEAEAAGQAMVEANLAACVNILPGMRSVYRWEGVVERAQETVMIVKTAAAQAETVVAAVKARHPYRTPAILVVPVTGGEPSYLAWIAAETAE